MEIIISFVSGLVIGIAIMLIINLIRLKDTKKIAQELVSKAESQKMQDLEILINRIKESFGSISFEALSKNTQEFLKIANETLSKQTELGDKELDNKKKLIDQTLDLMKTDLQKVQELVIKLEKDREQKFGQLASQLRSTAEQTGKLQETTGKLYMALASTKIRGQWGERMAEDVLRMVGLIEGINYYKQKVIDSANTRPDYTFILPQNLKVNMDVKFPLDNYLKYLDTTDEMQKENFKNLFLKDVRNRIKEVSTREYINPADNTVDYVLVFIPNEQVYNFINEKDQYLLDDALKNKVILCSPVTLYAILAIIRQSIDNFNMEKTASQILSLLGNFYKQWNEFSKSLEKIGKKIDEAQDEYQLLITRRKRALENPLKQIEDLRAQKHIDINENELEDMNRSKDLIDFDSNS